MVRYFRRRPCSPIIAFLSVNCHCGSELSSLNLLLGNLLRGFTPFLLVIFSDSSEELTEVSSFLTEIFETFPGCVELG